MSSPHTWAVSTFTWFVERATVRYGVGAHADPDAFTLMLMLLLMMPMLAVADGDSAGLFSLLYRCTDG